MASSRHHFVPQGYLRGFSCADRGRQFVWVYDKRPARAPACKSVKSIAWAAGYYAQERDDGSLDTDTLETGLAVTIDTKAAELINSLDPTGPILDLSQDHQALLALFVGLSLTRVPSFRDGVRDVFSQIAKYTAEMVAPGLWPGPGPPPELNVEAKEWVTLEPMIYGAQDIAESLLAKDWQFFRSHQDQPFITSDNPVIFNGPAPANPSSEVFMTLNSRLALVCTPRRSGYSFPIFDAPKQQVRSMNATIAKAARNRLFASYESDALDRLAKKHVHREQKLFI